MNEGPPLRLRDDPAVARALRDDLARATTRASAGYDVTAGLAKFEETLRTGAGAGAGAGTSAGVKTVLGAATKGALLGMAVLGGAAVLGDRSPSPSAAPTPPAVSVLVATVPTVDEGAIPLPPPSTPPLATVKPSIVQAPIRNGGSPQTTVTAAPRAQTPNLAEPAPPATSAVVVAPRAPESVAPTGAGGTLAAEMEHLARLRALQDSDPAQALALAAEGNQRFSAGLFTQEREAIAISALVRLGRGAEARARAGAFLSTYPRSAFAEQIKKLTGIGEIR